MIVRVFISTVLSALCSAYLEYCGKYWCYAYIVILALVEIHF